MVAKRDGCFFILLSNFDHWEVVWCSHDLNPDGPIATDLFEVGMPVTPI